MIFLELSGQEILQLQYILPIQGSLETLEIVNNIFDKVKLIDAKGMEGEGLFEFKEEEIELMNKMISYLDQNQKLHLPSLSLIHKIKGEKI